MRITSLLLCLSALLLAAETPLIHFDFRNLNQRDGIVPNSCHGGYRARVAGEYSVSPEGLLKMDGKSTTIVIENSENFDVMKGATFSIVYRLVPIADSAKAHKQMAGLFSKSRQFVLTEYHNRYYANFHDGKNWIGNFQTTPFKYEGGIFRHFVFTWKYHFNPNDAEEWIEQETFLDGVSQGKNRFEHCRPEPNSKPIEIGGCSCMGTPWMLDGEIGDVRIYNSVLSENEIRDINLEQPWAKPRFRSLQMLPQKEQKAIGSIAGSASQKSALMNFAMARYPDRSWKSMLERPSEHLLELATSRSSLVLVSNDGFTHPAGWYDAKNNREIFAAQNPLVQWTFEQGTKKYSLSPWHNEVVSKLLAPPEYKNGVWLFSIEYSHPASKDVPLAFAATTDFRFDGMRLDFKHHAKCLSEGALLFNVDYPRYLLAKIPGGHDVAFVPDGCGVEHLQPIDCNFKYSQPYPRVFATMQYMGYYSADRGGVYIASEDPNGRIKTMSLAAENGAVETNYAWRVPFSQTREPNAFEPGATAALELIEGNWHNAATVYKRQLKAMKAPWFIHSHFDEQLPVIRTNSYWLHNYYYGKYAPELIQAKDYIGLDAIVVDTWNWWEKGVCAHLTPHMHATPDWFEYTKFMAKNGITVIPYTDGRLWAQRDRRGEDYAYSKYGKPIGVVSDGRRIVEKYAVGCDVVCPATEIYQEFFGGMYDRLTAQGCPGIYIDQLGAAFEPPCQVAEHPHLVSDWDAWYAKGYARMLREVRNNWKKRGERHFLTTEDNAEIFAGIIDGFETYRWANDGQVPAFPMVYSGKVQFYNRCATPVEARIQATAEQLLNGEQLGPFTPRELLFPHNGYFRRIVKKMIWLRHGLTGVFNDGAMLEPPVFGTTMPQNRLLWSIFGTNFVTKPAVQSASWQWRDVVFTILVNTGERTIANSVQINGDMAQKLTIIDAQGQKKEMDATAEIRSCDFELEPGCFMVICVHRKKDSLLPDKLPKAMAQIAKVDAEPAPEYTVAGRVPQPDVLNAREPMNLVDSVAIDGANRNRRLCRVDYNYRSLIEAGMMDFGQVPAKHLFLEVACDRSLCGIVKVYIDEISPQNRIAEVLLPKGFSTGGPDKFEYAQSNLMKKVTGVQRVLFTVDGFFTFNLRNWKIAD